MAMPGGNCKTQVRVEERVASRKVAGLRVKSWTSQVQSTRLRDKKEGQPNIRCNASTEERNEGLAGDQNRRCEEAIKKNER